MLTELKAGHLSLGYYGIVPATEFIDGETLAQKIGLCAGTVIHHDEDWIQYVIDRRVCLVAKRPLRYGISWNAIDEVGAVFGEQQVSIQGQTFKVRLMRGSRTNPMTFKIGDNPDTTWGSEWNRVMYRLCEEDRVYLGEGLNHASNAGSVGVDEIGDEAPPEKEIWEHFKQTDLGVSNQPQWGMCSWCQEACSVLDVPKVRLLRGRYNGMFAREPSWDGVVTGWRPVLERV